MSGTVTVLTLNGRRQTVKVQPNTTILQIIEEVCTKHALKPEKHNLKHHRRVLDITLTIRFAGLPNNCLLELIEAENERIDLPVTIGVQTENGTRTMAEFPSSATILQVLQQLCPSEVTPTTVIIYMQNEIYGESLTTKTLKSLGLTSGRAMLRLIHREIETLKNQANVWAPLPLKPAIEQPQKRRIEQLDEQKPPENNEPINKAAFKMSTLNQSLIDEVRQQKQKKTEGLKIKSSKPPKLSKETITFPEEHDFAFLGERKALLFSVETAEMLNDDVPDDFFELTINEMKQLYLDIKQKRLEMENLPLMTDAMRSLENSKKQLRTLSQYKQTVIRIQFPNRIILQGVFQCWETIEEVSQFVREYLADKSMDFHLFTTPPKYILPPASNLLEAECVPGALLYFGCEEKRDNYLRSEIFDKIASNSSASLAAAQIRGNNVHANKSSNEMEVDSVEIENSSPAIETYTNLPKTKTQPENVPKWFRST